MRNAILFGLYIGLLSGVWLLATHWFGYETFDHNASVISYIPILIPVSGLFLGILSFRKFERKGRLTFLQALIQCFDILILGGLMAGLITIGYVHFILAKFDMMDTVGWLFGAIPVSCISSVVVSLVLKTR